MPAKNQFHPDIIAKHAEQTAAEAARKLAEQKKIVDAVNAESAKNRIMTFNCGKPRHALYPEFREPNPLQAKMLEAWENPKYKTFVYSSGNRGGKTTLGAIIAISTVYGAWPWNGKKFTFPHNQPRKVRYVGQAWESHVKVVLEPALRFWWPECMPVRTKKNNQGVDATWEYYARGGDREVRGTIEIMSNVQDSSVFEGWHGDLIVYDEPPKRDVRIACARGLIDRGGRELFCMTLINEAWILREVIRATDKDGNPDTSIFHITGDTYTNLGYGIKNREDIEQFAKMLTEEERKARIDGVPFNMSSLVCPKFDRNIHIKDRFTIPLDAIVDISIDWHPSKPLAVVFLATTKQGFKYVCEEIKFAGNPKSAAEEVIRVIRQHQYRVGRIVIDPLSKSGMPNETDVFSVFSETFSAFGYSLETASKEKDSGIGMLNGLLWTENQMPALYFFKDCRQTISEVEDLMFDPSTFKPEKVRDDYFECLYRLCLMDTQWYPVYEVGKSMHKAVVL